MCRVPWYLLAVNISPLNGILTMAVSKFRTIPVMKTMAGQTSQLPATPLHRLKAAEGKVAAAEEREDQLERDLGELNGLLAAEKEAAARGSTAAVARAVQDGEAAVADAVAEAEGRSRKAVEGMEAQIASKEHELQVCCFSALHGHPL